MRSRSAAPGPGEILVEVGAAGINFIDTYRRSGVYPMDYPHTVGVEGSGVVAEVGEGVTAWSAGDRVAWHDGPGSYATRTIVRADMAMRVPEGIDFDVAAAIPLQGLTAQYLVTDSHRIEAGQTALVHAAAGGVGLLLIQLIKHLGGRVIGTVSTEEKAAARPRCGSGRRVPLRRRRRRRRDGARPDGRPRRGRGLRRSRQGHVRRVAQGDCGARLDRAVRRSVRPGAPVRHPAAQRGGRSLPVPPLPRLVRPHPGRARRRDRRCCSPV